MTVERSTPDVGYIDPDFFKSAGVSQCVRANGFVHMSGIVSARGTGEVVAPGDMKGQIEFILSTLRKLLAGYGLDMSDLVSTVLYATDMPALVASASTFADAFIEHPPTSTWIEVKGLAQPELMLEVVAIAAVR